jgi:hypothetical protein
MIRVRKGGIWFWKNRPYHLENFGEEFGEIREEFIKTDMYTESITSLCKSDKGST